MGKELFLWNDLCNVGSAKERLESVKQRVSGRFRIYEGVYGVGILGDSFDVLNLLKGIGFEAIITDPPFLDKKEHFVKKQYGGVLTDEIIFKMEDLLYDVLLDGGWFIIFWSVKNLPRAFGFKKFRYMWTICAEFHSTYSKCIIGDRKWLPILCFAKGNAKVVLKRPDIIPAEEVAVIQEKLWKADFKPTFVNSRLIQMFLPRGGVVLDPFAGWGSLPLVCEIFGRAWVAIELQQERFDFMVRLIENFRNTL
jgi:DNA modification methylase